MEKMFKRSVLGAAVALAAVSGSANAAIELAGEAVQVYGQAAGFVHITNPSDTRVTNTKTLVQTDGTPDSTISSVIESRIGFKGVVEFEQIEPDLVWQIESGDASNPSKSGYFGARDTFVGLNFDGIGSVKYGRQLVAAYNYVDWPHTNPGLGNVFDWNNDIGVTFEDRADNVIRFDSANFSGFNVQATLSGMGASTKAAVMSIAGSYTRDMFTVHAGYYGQKGWQVNVPATGPVFGVNPGTGNVEELTPAKPASTNYYGDVSYYIVGGSVYLQDVTLTAAYKAMENRGVAPNEEKRKQNAYSLTAQYILDQSYVFKVGYAGTTDSKGKTYTYDDADKAITGRLGYLLPSAYLYFDVRHYDMASNNAIKDEFTKSKTTNFLIGAEYYF